MAIGLIARTVSLHLKLELSEHVVNVTTTSSGTTITIKREASAAELWQHLKGKFEKQDGASAMIDFGRPT